MKKRVVVCLIVLLLLISFISSAGYLTRNSNKKINQKIAQTTDNKGEIRVMVNLADVSEEKKAEIVGRIGKEKLRNDFGDSFSVQLSSKDLELVESIQGVESVKPVGVRKLLLKDSVGIVNATLANSIVINNLNLTGAGQTVCIIDTGVNYSHADLGGCYGSNNISSTCKIIGGWDYYNSDSNPYDDNGHGTHVAGIVAANGTIKGVAPDAKIIAIKACDSTGNICTDDAINAGINFCVNNASLFNISVISMSLGSGLYDDYCNNDSLAAAINSAVAKNISVVVAAGNDGYYDVISAPACVQNATPVGATEKEDTIALYSNTNWMVQLLAPGSSINSTYLSASGYGVLDGTSMATPHVSGAIAIINQYLSLTGRTRTPAQVESILNATGKAIVDAGNSNLTFYRINIYAALMSFNITSNLQTPANNTAVNINLTNFTCYSETGINSSLLNVTFYLWNSSKTLLYNETKNISGTTNTTSFNYTFSLEGNYLWNCLAKNNISGSALASSNNTLIYDVTKPTISLISPADAYSTTSTSLPFVYNITETNSIANCSLIISGAVSASNLSITNLSANQSITQTFSAGSYTWAVNCTDSAGNIANSSLRSLTIESAPTPPSSGGGGGGGGGSSAASTFYPSQNQVFSGYTQELKKDDSVRFSAFSGENHSVKIGKIESGSAEITVASNPFNVTLYVGIEKKINLSSADYYDLSLKLNSISNNKANVTIKAINELIKKSETLQNINESILKTANNLNKTASKSFAEQIKLARSKIYICAIAVLIVIAVVFVLIRMQKKNKTADKPKSKKKKI